MKARASNEGSGGKLVDTWWYEYTGIVEEAGGDAEGETPPKQTINAKKVAVELRLLKKFAGDAPPLAVKEVWFRVSCTKLKFVLEGSDMELLRAAMWEKLDAKFKVHWENFLLVQVEPVAVYEGRGAGLLFSYKNVEKGTAWDGTLLLREWQHHGTRIRPWPGEFVDKNHQVLACIPATSKNKRDLKLFADKVDALRDAMADLLRPEVVLQTLQGVFRPLLAASEPLEVHCNACGARMAGTFCSDATCHLSKSGWVVEVQT